MKKILLFACLLASMGMYAQEIEVDHEFGNQLAHPFLQFRLANTLQVSAQLSHRYRMDFFQSKIS